MPTIQERITRQNEIITQLEAARDAFNLAYSKLLVMDDSTLAGLQGDDKPRVATRAGNYNQRFERAIERHQERIEHLRTEREIRNAMAADAEGTATAEQRDLLRTTLSGYLDGGEV